MDNLYVLYRILFVRVIALSIRGEEHPSIFVNNEKYIFKCFVSWSNQKQEFYFSKVYCFTRLYLNQFV